MNNISTPNGKKNKVKLVDNDLTGDELINRVVISKTNEGDFDKMCQIISKAFNLNSEDIAELQLENADVLINESVKLYDEETGEIYGILTFCNFPIIIGSPIYRYDKKLADFLKGFKQVNGHSFVIDERLRHYGLDRKMLMYNLKYLSENYDFIWCGVKRGLNTDNYWMKHGFIKIFDIPEASFFLFPFNKNIL